MRTFNAEQLSRIRAAKIGANNPMWKGADASPESGRARARRLYPDPVCDFITEGKECGEPAERHHRDGDTHNNEPDNVAFRCRRHHMAEDGRLQEMVARNKSDKHPKSGKPMSVEARALISAATKGKPKSPETRAKLSAAMIGRPAWNKGIPRTPKERAAMRAGIAAKRRTR